MVFDKKEYNREYNQKHKEELRAHRREYKQKHKEEIRAHRREYYQKHKEELRTYQREYNQKHKEEIRAHQRKYNQKHKEEIRAHQRKYYQKHKEEIRIYRKAYYARPENRDYFKNHYTSEQIKKRVAYSRRRRALIKAGLWVFLDGKTHTKHKKPTHIEAIQTGWLAYFKEKDENKK